MNAPNRTSLLRMAVLTGVATISFLANLPASAQNPRPTIFNEPPYNRPSSPPSGSRPGQKLGHGHHHRPGQQSAQGLRRPPGDGSAPAPQPDAPPTNRP